MIGQIIGAFLAVLALGVVQNIPRKFLLIAGSISSISWFVYLVCDYSGLSVGISTLFATLIAALCAHILARICKAPVTLFLIPGILPLVPGVNTYRIVYYLIQKEGQMAVSYFYLTLQIAGMIAIGVFIMDSYFRILATMARDRKLRKLLVLRRQQHKETHKNETIALKEEPKEENPNQQEIDDLNDFDINI